MTNNQYNNWIDSRIKSPSSNAYDRYYVTFKYYNHIFIGYASWMPDDGYKTGSWTNITTTNGNKLDGEVLAWMPHPNIEQWLLDSSK